MYTKITNNILYLTLIGLLINHNLGLIQSISINDNKQNFNNNNILRDSNNNNNNNYELINNINKSNSNSNYFSENYDNVNINENNLVNDNNNNNNDDDLINKLTLSDQVKLLTKQLNALMMRRREDYKLLENNLKKSILNSVNGIENNLDIKNELQKLRHELNEVKTSKSVGNKEKLTVDWLTESIAEMRSELSELQEIASNTSKTLNRRHQIYEDIATIKNDFRELKLEMELIKERQQTTDFMLNELKEEALQKEEDFRKILHHHKHKITENEFSKEITKNSDLSEADHRMRHQRFVRQQLHDLETSQRTIKRQLHELQYHHIGDRVHKLEIEQNRLANGNFNLSRQISNLDKLHTSMLELLEDVTGIQSKIDKTLPDIKREISKLEFQSAQLNSEQSLLREEGHNMAKSIQAIAVSISTLQDERDNFKDYKKTMQNIQDDVEHLKSVTDAQNSIVHRTIEKMEINAKTNHHKSINNLDEKINTNTEKANNLVQQLESVELQFESIINKLPSDCSQVEILSMKNKKNNIDMNISEDEINDDNINDENDDDIDVESNEFNNEFSSSKNKISEKKNNEINRDGLYLIAPAGQHHPTMAYCNAGGWTTIQRRYDGSVDFNQTWESYAKGFGSPSGEFWIGNEMLHHLTLDNCTKLKIIMQDIYDNTWYVEYNQFYISSRDDGYRLHVSNYKGNASDALDYQNRMQFSAIDVDRDISNTHCAANYEGGWWFSHCQHANLNGRYNLGLTWFDASRNEWIAVKSSHMLITKRQNCVHSIKKRNIINKNNDIKNIINKNSNNNINLNSNAPADINEINVKLLRNQIFKSLITTETSLLKALKSNVTTISTNGIS